MSIREVPTQLGNALLGVIDQPQTPPGLGKMPRND
jgi:hypothetical protein